MLSALRKKSSSFFALILFGLLILSFALWGINDVFRGGMGRAVAKVAGEDITAPELQSRASERAARGNQPISSINLTQVTQELVNEHLFAAFARDAGLVVSENRLREYTARLFADEQGRFNRAIYEGYLRGIRRGLSETAFQAELSRQIAQLQILSATGQAAHYPAFTAQVADQFDREQRQAAFLFIPDDYVTDIPAPTEEEMQAHLEQYAMLYRTPEMREIKLITIDPEDLFEKMTASEEEIQQAYELQVATEAGQIRGQYQQVSLASRQGAQRVLDLMSSDGLDFETAVEQATSGSGVIIDTGFITASELRHPDLTAAAHEMEVGAVSDPVETSGFAPWVLLHLAEKRSGAAPLEDMREDIIFRIRNEKALAELDRLLKILTDGVAGGVSLAELAEETGLPLIRFDATRQSAAATPTANLSGIQGLRQILDTAFNLPAPGSAGPATLRSRPHFVLEVDRIIPARNSRLDEVQINLREDMLRERRARAVMELADQWLADHRTGTPLAELAERGELQYRTTEALSRPRSGEGEQEIPNAALARLFQLSHIGESVRVSLPDGEMILRLVDILPPEDISADAHAANLDAQMAQLSSAFAADLLDMFLQDLQQTYRVRVNHEVIEAQQRANRN